MDALERMLVGSNFSFPQQQLGLEIELNLIDADLGPAMVNTVVLDKIRDPAFTAELGMHNLELNVRPRPLAGDQTSALERDLLATLRMADDKAADAGASVVMVGILPSIAEEHFDARWISPVPRYDILNKRIVAACGGYVRLNMVGTPLAGHATEILRAQAESILPEAACTSVQLHVQVEPHEFAAHWNAAQCLAGPQVAIAANSPFLLRKALWHETRVPLFCQATDTRRAAQRNKGTRPRVWFGERWITSVFDLFEENVRYFPYLLPATAPEDPFAALAAGRPPTLAALKLHNGTIWRWNRPVYDVVSGKPQLRIENRVLPAGPTVVDMLANAALFYGAQRMLAAQNHPLWTGMSFAEAEANFYACARDGMDATLRWPGAGTVRAGELVLDELLPMAHAGLRQCGVSDAVRERYLGVIERRCHARQNGASWQRDTVASMEADGLHRRAALSRMLARYVELMHVGDPVHTWPVRGE